MFQFWKKKIKNPSFDNIAAYDLLTLKFGRSFMAEISFSKICLLPFVFLCIHNVNACLQKCSGNKEPKESFILTVVIAMDDETYIYCLGMRLCVKRAALHTCLYVLTSASCLKQENMNNIQVRKCWILIVLRTLILNKKINHRCNRKCTNFILLKEN